MTEAQQRVSARREGEHGRTAGERGLQTLDAKKEKPSGKRRPATLTLTYLEMTERAGRPGGGPAMLTRLFQETPDVHVYRHSGSERFAGDEEGRASSWNPSH